MAVLLGLCAPCWLFEFFPVHSCKIYARCGLIRTLAAVPLRPAIGRADRVTSSVSSTCRVFERVRPRFSQHREKFSRPSTPGTNVTNGRPCSARRAEERVRPGTALLVRLQNGLAIC